MKATPSNTLDKKALVFIHIPKTGGLTMEGLISRQYPKKSTFWLSLQRPELVSEFAAMPKEDRAKLECLMGHIPFGYCKHLPRPATHATLLRDPVARFISEYRHLVRFPRPGAWLPPPAALETLNDYLDYRIQTNATNIQTRLISGHFPEFGEMPPFEPLPDTALEEAKQNLREQFAVVGVTERFDETLLLLKHRMGWTKRVYYARRNAAPTKFSIQNLDPALVERIREHYKEDAELVKYGEELLNAAIEREGAGFADELAALKRVNHRIFLVFEGWKSTPLWKLRDVPGIRQLRHLIGRFLSQFA